MRYQTLASVIFLAAAGCSPAPTVSTLAGAPVPASGSKIMHLVVIEQENHTFDAYFGRYCTATAATSCTAGHDCCEAAPAQVATTDGICSPDTDYLTNTINGSRDPNHNAAGELTAMDRSGQTFKMDKYGCADVKYAQVPDSSWQTSTYPVASTDAYPLLTYHNLAYNGALADRYFQPIVGASCSNDMFLARASFMFQDNKAMPVLVEASGRSYLDDSVGDLLDRAGVTWNIYMEGFERWQQGDRTAYPNGFDAADNAFSYFKSSQARIVDLTQLQTDLGSDTLPSVSLVRPLGIKSEHPGYNSKITDGEAFVQSVIQQVQASSAAANTLILITWDEGGGFYDHVVPPTTLADGSPMPTTQLATASTQEAVPAGEVDQAHIAGSTLPQKTSDPEYYVANAGKELYGTRIPLLAVGPFVKTDYISHVDMEHSSIVRFIEWNWLNGTSLGTRDVHVNNLGDMLDPQKTGVTVPQS